MSLELAAQSSCHQPAYSCRLFCRWKLPTDWRYRIELELNGSVFHVEASFHTGNIAYITSADGAASRVASRLPLQKLHHWKSNTWFVNSPPALTSWRPSALYVKLKSSRACTVFWPMYCG